MRYSRLLLGTAALAAITSGVRGDVYQLDDTAIGDGNKSKYADSTNVSAGTAGTIVLSSSTHAGWTGIDDSFDGQVIVTFTEEVMSSQATLNASGAVNLDFYANGGSERVIAIGNPWFTGYWGYWKAPRNPDQSANLLDGGGSTVGIGDGNSSYGTQTMVLTIDFVAGGSDSATILFAEGLNTLPAGDYSFDEIMCGAYNAPTNFSNMAVEVIEGGGGGGGGGSWTGVEGTFNLPDASIDNGWYTSYGSGPDITPAGFVPIDDTFEGQVIFTFTTEVLATMPSMASAGAVNFTVYSGEERILAVGNAWFTGNWSFWKAVGAPDAEINILDDGGSPVLIGDGTSSADTQTFIVTMNYVAGGLDSGTVRFADATATTDIPAADYSFTSLMAGGGGAATNFKDMTMEIIYTGGSGGDDTWAGYEIDSSGNVDTGDWMGLVNVSNKPYIFNYTLGTYLYMEEAAVTEDGCWVYIYN